MGITALSCHTNNGVFTAAAFRDELAKMEQGLTLSGVGAHHQNAVAERAIGSVVSIARTMMLHAKLRWPKAVSTKLWPMAMKHAQHLLNHVPNQNNMCPMDIILKMVVPRHVLQHTHVWGAPVFVLDPRLQDGHKIPKFDPRSRQGLNLGWSPKHASTVPLVLNLTTGKVSPQFHVVFDDWFSTVSSKPDGTEEPIDGEDWTNLLVSDKFQVHFDENDNVELDDEWLTELERIERHQQAAARVQQRMPEPAPRAEDDGSSPVVSPARVPQQVQQPVIVDGVAAPKTPVAVPPTTMEQGQQREQQQSAAQKQEQKSPPAHQRKLRPRPKQWQEPGHFKKWLNRLAILMAASNGPILAMAKDVVGSPAAHVAMAGFDAVTETFDCVDFVSFKAMTAPVKMKGKKGIDPDFPTFQQAMNSPDSEE